MFSDAFFVIFLIRGGSFILEKRSATRKKPNKRNKRDGHSLGRLWYTNSEIKLLIENLISKCEYRYLDCTSFEEKVHLAT